MRRLAGWILVVAGAAVALPAAWIPAKAWVAQELLARAWERAAATGAPAPPWPWADTGPVARLSVRRLGVDRIVLAGSSGAVLAFAPGHVAGTALPGDGGHSIVAGHRDTSFRFLRELVAGDRIVVDRPGGRRALYVVEATTVLDAADPAAFAVDGAVLTLVTCWPFDAPVAGGRERYLVRTRRLDVAPAASAVEASAALRRAAGGRAGTSRGG